MWLQGWSSPTSTLVLHGFAGTVNVYFDTREFALTSYFVLRAQLPSLQPGQTPQQSGAALSNNGVPPDRPGAITLPSGPPPRPPGLHKPRPVHSVGRPLPSDGSPHHQMQKPEIISFWRLICIAVGLLFVAVLILTYDPLDMIIDIESVKLRASIENATLAFEKEKTERERKVMVHERELWERAREARVPQDAFWDVVWPAWDCRAYGKREYWGILRNTPDDWNAIDACMSMPVEIKGVKIRRPDRCAGVFVFPPEIQVRGYWMVDWDQPDCKPWYRDFEDKVLVPPILSLSRTI